MVLNRTRKRDGPKAESVRVWGVNSYYYLTIPIINPSMPIPSKSPIPFGTRVELHGLKAKRQLNGQYGIVVDYVASSSRCTVALEGSRGKTETKMNIKPENLKWK